jgi:hypothetical protein
LICDEPIGNEPVRGEGSERADLIEPHQARAVEAGIGFPARIPTYAKLRVGPGDGETEEER